MFLMHLVRGDISLQKRKQHYFLLILQRYVRFGVVVMEINFINGRRVQNQSLKQIIEKLQSHKAPSITA